MTAETATHTPGPWGVSNRLVYARDAWGVKRSQYNVTGIIGGSSGRTIAEVGEWTDRPNAEADARLIAAAPSLLAELRETAAMLDRVSARHIIGDSDKALVSARTETARAAIEEATS